MTIRIKITRNSDAVGVHQTHIQLDSALIQCVIITLARIRVRRVIQVHSYDSR